MLIDDFLLDVAQITVENRPYKLYHGGTLKLFAGLNSTPHLLDYFEYTTIPRSESNDMLLVSDFILVATKVVVEHRPY